MRASRNSQRLLVGSAVLVLLIVAGLAIIAGLPKGVAPAIVSIITPTGVRPSCGLISASASSTFPLIDTANCPPDPSALPRKTWRAVNPRLNLQGAAITACEDWYAYHTNQTGNWEVFRLNTSSNPVNLSRGGGRTNNLAPAVSPDGSQIAFASDRDGNWEIYIARADGSDEPQRLTYNTFAVDMAPLWSPDGKSLVFASIRKGNWDLFQFDVASGAESQLTNSPANDLFPSWSPDGKQIIYQSARSGNSQIYSVDVESLASKALTNGDRLALGPVFSPDGKQISYLSAVSADGSRTVSIMNADGTNARPVSDAALNAANESFSPDGRLLIYEAHQGEASAIYAYDMQAGQSHAITAPNVLSFAPTWSCDSKQIVFSATANGTTDLYRVGLDPFPAQPIDVTSGAKRLTSGNGNSQYAVGALRIENASRQNMLALRGTGG